MNLLDLVMQAQGGGAVRQMAEQFGIDEGQAQSAISAVLPMLAGAMQQNVQSGGADGLLNALQNGNHEKYLDDPGALFSPAAVDDGNGILGHLLGSKEVSRQVATHAAAESGVNSAIIKQMLPMVAGMLMGGLSRQANSGDGGLMGQVLGSLMGGGTGAVESQQAAPAAGILGMLGPLLDQNRNGSALDDVLGMASQFLSSRR
jgi:hypothetical protein